MVTKSAFDKVPLQAHLRTAWFIFTLVVVTIWTKVYFDESIHAKSCLVKENEDGTFTQLNYMDKHLGASDSITNVSSRFEYLSVSYLAQGVLSLIAVLYQLVAIYCNETLLMYRHYISRVNKLIQLYGAYILVMTHIYRLDEPGKMCSGDYLTEAERHDPAVTSSYLIETGRLFYIYMVCIWIIAGAACVFGSVICY